MLCVVLKRGSALSMGVVNTRTSYTLVDSSKPLAEGSGEVSRAIETGNRQDRQQRWVVAVRGW